jgi:2-polyprenyl-3-methyl-5-hydroxy-6-metoxy-1,4-benzoquinol methylase
MKTNNMDQERVQSNFEFYARSFDGIYGSPERKSVITHFLDKWLRKSMFLRFRKTLKNINHPDIHSVLDVGCGSGRYCAEFLKMGKTVAGVDIASEMLNLAKALCKKEVPEGLIKFINGNYIDVELGEKYDVAVLMGLFDYIENPQPLLIKLKKDINNIILATFPKDNNLLNSIRKVRYYFFKNCPLYFYSKNGLENLFKSCGFDQFSISDSDREYYVKIDLRQL